MTRSPQNSKRGSTSSTPRATTAPKAGPTTKTTTSRGEPAAPEEVVELFEAIKRTLISFDDVKREYQAAGCGDK